MSAATPGPWRIGHSDETEDEALSWDAISVTGFLDLPVTTIEAGLPESVPNARLIAAAPDLLSALREALEFVDALQDGAPDAAPEHRRAADLYGRLSDVIERATGGAS